MENKKTAVEWLVEQLRQFAFHSNHHLGLGDIRLTQGQIDELEEQAKQMEKQQRQIELPSDEEIEEKSHGFSDWPKEKASFSHGAKWMKDKIQGGNK